MPTNLRNRTVVAPLQPAAFVALALIATTLGAQAPAAPSSAASAAPAWAARLDSLVLSELERTRTPGAQVAVVVDGKVVHARGYGVADVETGRPVTARTLFRVGSVTKMVTAAALTQLAADGKLDLDAPIGTYVPEIAGRRIASATTHQLLTHSAGWLDNAIPYGRMGEGALGEVFREVTDTLLFTEPGRVISYSNPGYSMAGYVAEMAGKGRFGSLVDQYVVKAMGMPHATFRPLQALTLDFSQGHVGQAGNPGAIVRPFTENTAQWAAGFLMASAGEMAAFAITLMDGGMLEGRRVLAESAVKRMTTGHMPIPGNPNAKYGYGLMIQRSGEELVWQHGGSINGFDAQVTMFPERKLAIVVLDNRSGAPLQGVTDLVAREAAGVQRPPTPALPDERVATPAERAQLVGRYAMGNTRVELFEEGGELKFRQGPVTLPVRLVGDERIVVTPPGGAKVTLLLVRGADGRVEYLHQGLRAIARQP